MRTILLDADIVAYQFAATNEGVWYFNGRGEEPSVHVGDLSVSTEGADEFIRTLMTRLAADRLIICLTDRGNEFRKDIAPYYKANRKGKRKPALLFPVLDYFAEKYETYLRPRLEADDCMGILSTHPTLIRGEKIIVSEDKDMATIPGLLFNPRLDIPAKGAWKPRRITKLQADRFHLWQAIVGDTADGYPGAFRVGEKSPEANAVLRSRSVREAWGHVMAAFSRAPLPPDTTPEQEAIRQARLARILRASDWNFKEKKPVLWCPPS